MQRICILFYGDRSRHLRSDEKPCWLVCTSKSLARFLFCMRQMYWQNSELSQFEARQFTLNRSGRCFAEWTFDRSAKCHIDQCKLSSIYEAKNRSVPIRQSRVDTKRIKIGSRLVFSLCLQTKLSTSCVRHSFAAPNLITGVIEARSHLPPVYSVQSTRVWANSIAQSLQLAVWMCVCLSLCRRENLFPFVSFAKHDWRPTVWRHAVAEPAGVCETG